MVFVRHFEQSKIRKRKYLIFKMCHKCNKGCSYHYCAKSELRFCAGVKFCSLRFGGPCNGPCFQQWFMFEIKLYTLLPVKHPTKSIHHYQG